MKGIGQSEFRYKPGLRFHGGAWSIFVIMASLTGYGEIGPCLNAVGATRAWIVKE